MGEQEPKRAKKHISVGLLAHVDAGKTTLSESMLYLTGAVRKLGRVDHQTAFLDTNAIERTRGITVFSKEARFTLGDTAFTLLDTPGHADFGGEMERTLSVLDYAILLISGSDGVQSHTVTLWRLLALYHVPTFVFVNKMDQPGTDRAQIMADLRANLGDGFCHLDGPDGAEAEAPTFVDPEEAAMCSESMMEEYLEWGAFSAETVRQAVAARQVFPVCFGSALKMTGVEAFLTALQTYTRVPDYPAAFGARVFKITRDKQGARQTHMKITGGSLRSKMVLRGGFGVSMEQIGAAACGASGTEDAEASAGAAGTSGGAGKETKAAPGWEEKVDQIRLYSGTGFQMVQEAEAGTICTVTGLSRTYAGEGLGITADLAQPVLEPPLTYQVLLPEGADPVVIFRKLRQLEEENPLLHMVWKEALQEIHVQVMGDLELEILQHIIKERFDLEVSFGAGSLIYKETIAAPVIGIGHFEPLRHYAEVHLLLEPGAPGSGLVLDTLCSEDKLARNWQRLILTHLQERSHPGVLTGAEITDMKITLLAGRAHIKHTEGGDFRQATYRAVRQGLHKAMAEGGAVLLEPFYQYRLEVPTENVGRAMADLQRFGASCEAQSEPAASGTGRTVLTGQGPVSTLRDYQREVAAYTRGNGRFLASMAGYRPCHNQEEILENKAYRPEQDLENPTGSVFCEHGAAVYVNWDQVDQMAHVESGFRIAGPDGGLEQVGVPGSGAGYGAGGKQAGAGGIGGNGLTAAGEKELEEIFLRTYGKSKRDEALRRAHQSEGTRKPPAPENFPTLNWKGDNGAQPYLIVDGYNVIFAWDELKELARINLDGAREAFLEALGNYQGYKKMGIMVVFDGYRVPGNPGTRQRYGDVEVVFTKEAETADRFIEKMTYELAWQYKIMVVTSDRLVQMAAMGDGAARMSAREFYQEVMGTSEEIRSKLQQQVLSKNRPFEGKL